MKKEIKKYVTVCDICESELCDNDIRTNREKFDEPYYKTGSFDICYICAGKLFSTQIGSKLTPEKLEVMIKKTKELLNPDNPFGEKLEMPVEFIGTNSIETSKITSNQTKTPLESSQKAMNGMFEVHPESEIKFSNSLNSIDEPKSIKDL
jgi:hypothetical protein